jgi:hypothetical protein
LRDIKKLPYIWGIMILFILVCLFVVGAVGYVMTRQLYLRYRRAYHIERHLHLETLLECRALYENMNRHLKINGLGELPAPELMERETIKRLNDETNLYIDPTIGVTSRMRN